MNQKQRCGNCKFYKADWCGFFTKKRKVPYWVWAGAWTYTLNKSLNGEKCKAWEPKDESKHTD